MEGNRMLTFGEGVEAVLRHLRESGLGPRRIGEHEGCYRRLGDWLRSTGTDYGADVALDWLEATGAHLCDKTRRTMRLALDRLWEACSTGRVATRCRALDCGPRPYLALPDWARGAVDGYVSTVGPGRRNLARAASSRLLAHAASLGATAVGDVGPGTVASFRREVASSPGSGATKAQWLCGASAFLRREAELGEVSGALWMLALDRFADRGALYADVDADDRRGVLGADGFLALGEAMLAEPDVAGYSDTVRKTVARAIRVHYLFLELNGLGYSPGLARLWLEERRADLGYLFTHARRSLLLLERYRTTGRVAFGTLYRAPSVADVPDWAAPAVDAVIAEKRREGLADSTVTCYRSCAKRLFAFLDGRGARSLGDVTPALVADFAASDAHASPGGKACYLAKARAILESLSDSGAVAPGLSVPLESRAAGRGRIVEVLGEADVARIAGAVRGASAPMELRDAAMAAIGLAAGLRASDVVGLRLTDVDWRARTLRVCQRKTGRPVELPLPPLAAAAILRYLREGRPESAAPTVFVSRRHPRGPLAPSACGAALARVLGRRVGFHALRRTFATGVLRGGSGMRDVADALGHAGTGSLAPYLSLDAERMRLCALPLPRGGR